jgi:ribosomal protein S18 acetylase RimI-like enzyme
MNRNELNFKKVKFSSKSDYRKLDSILRNWFSDPKTLNFVSPKSTYPFEMKDWVKKNYLDQVDKEVSITASKLDWVIGFGSISMSNNNGHLFNVIIDKAYRNKGIGTELVSKLEKIGQTNKLNTFSVNIYTKNEPAINLYKKSGYKIKKESIKTLKMVKSI